MPDRVEIGSAGRPVGELRVDQAMRQCPQSTRAVLVAPEGRDDVRDRGGFNARLMRSRATRRRVASSQKTWMAFAPDPYERRQAALLHEASTSARRRRSSGWLSH